MKTGTIPEDNGNFGILVLGFSDMFPKTMINDQGLAMDGFATEFLEVEETRGKKAFKGDLFLEVLKKCSTVEEALEMISDYKLDFLSQSQIFMGDKTGDSAVIEGDVIHRKENSYQVVTNFNLSRTEHISCYRYKTASQILDAEGFSYEGLSTALQKTRRQMHTQYSYILNLTEGSMELFFFGDFETSETFDISSMKTGFEITESDGKLFLILKNYEHQLFLSKGGSFFFDRLDYVLRFQEKSSEKIDGIEFKNIYDGVKDFAKKVHPFWYWILTL